MGYDFARQFFDIYFLIYNREITGEKMAEFFLQEEIQI